jgi:N6-L-threonylcarbamoyladenine synthase
VVRSSVVASQIDRHARFGGVVPEIASRAHVELLTPVVAESLVEAGLSDQEVEAVAATSGPGLVGALLVGLSAAKALALVWDVPFVAVNHLEGHLYAAFLEEPDLELPMVVLLVSGGHTMIVHMEEHGRYTLLGSTIDDAAGEAFDKVARYLGLGYPGGPVIDKLAAEGDPEAVDFPRAMADRGYDFSFSGLKTAVVNYVRAHPDTPTEDIAASFQEAVVDVLVTKTMKAAKAVGAKGVCLGGGCGGQLVAAPAAGGGRHRRRVPPVRAEPVDVHRQRRHDRRRGLVAAPVRRAVLARRRRHAQPEARLTRRRRPTVGAVPGTARSPGPRSGGATSVRRRGGRRDGARSAFLHGGRRGDRRARRRRVQRRQRERTPAARRRPRCPPVPANLPDDVFALGVASGDPLAARSSSGPGWWPTPSPPTAAWAPSRSR